MGEITLAVQPDDEFSPSVLTTHHIHGDGYWYEVIQDEMSVNLRYCETDANDEVKAEFTVAESDLRAFIAALTDIGQRMALGLPEGGLGE